MTDEQIKKLTLGCYLQHKETKDWYRAETISTQSMSEEWDFVSFSGKRLYSLDDLEPIKLDDNILSVLGLQFNGGYKWVRDSVSVCGFDGVEYAFNLNTGDKTIQVVLSHVHELQGLFLFLDRKLIEL